MRQCQIKHTITKWMHWRQRFRWSRSRVIVGEGESIEDSKKQRVSTHSLYLLAGLGKETRQDLARIRKGTSVIAHVCHGPRFCRVVRRSLPQNICLLLFYEIR